MDLSSSSQIRLTGLNGREIADLHATVEHLIVVGSKVRRDQERHVQFQERHEPELLQQPYVDEPQQQRPPQEAEAEEESSASASASVSTRPVGSGVTLACSEHVNDWDVYPEDVRIYGPPSYYCSAYRGFGHLPWPNRPHTASKFVRGKGKPSPRLHNNDEEWNIEHGDTIHPLAFANARLSQGPPLRTNSSSTTTTTEQKDKERMNGKNLHVSTTDTSLPSLEVPRALLLKCWERAVHAASCTMRMPTPVSVNTVQRTADTTQQPPPDRTANTDTTNTNTNTNTEPANLHADSTATAPAPATDPITNNAATTTTYGGNILGLADGDNNPDVLPAATAPPKSNYYVSEQERTSKDREATFAKCQSLGMVVNSFGPCVGNACPNCARSFLSYQDLKGHYYGGSHKKGCCWRNIPLKHRSMVAKVLESHVTSQTDLLLELLLDKAKERVPDDEPSTKRQRFLNWYDVLKLLENTVESSSSQRVEGDATTTHSSTTHAILETLQTKPDASPLLLNPTILESIRRRLVDRYADVQP
jgi:hypothetical protein